MQRIWIVLGCIGLFAVIVIFVAKSSYNGLATSAKDIDQQWAQVLSDYKSRAHLVWNLVDTVSGVATFDKSALTALIHARNSVGTIKVTDSAPNDASTLQQFEQAQDNLSNALSRLMVVAENDPQLKSNQGFLDLKAQLDGTENRIAIERDKFNQAVQDYNNRVVGFPTMIVAHMGGFAAKPCFSAAP